MLALACQVRLFDNIILPSDLFLMEFTLFCCKICFAAIYVVLSQNLFCRSLRTFCVETTYGQNVVLGEKMTNIMYGPLLWQFSISNPKTRIMSQSLTCKVTQYFIIGLHDKKTKWYLHKLFKKHLHNVKSYPRADNFTHALHVTHVTNIMSGFGHLAGQYFL